jgi:hypothetical protein
VAGVTRMPSYRGLDPARIVATTEHLARRVAERFPGSGLGRLADELAGIAKASAERAEQLTHPHWPTRAAVSAVIVGIVALGVWTLTHLPGSGGPREVAAMAQFFESAVNDVVFVGIAIAFLLSLEPRRRRRAALAAIHELRSVAHLVDMHQLTKDPESVLSGAVPTPSSPQRTMTRFELARYLDYCSEMLSLTSKLAALFAQHVNDPIVLNAVNDVETLTTGLSRKIWQKVMILDTVART